MTTKTNLTQPTYNSPDWNTPLNANFGVLNDALGNTESVSVALADVTLTATQAQKMRIAVSGTLTANRTLFFPAGCTGFWIITNGTTGAYTLTVQNVAGAASVTIAQGISAIVYSDGTTVRFAADIAAGSIGTSLIADGAVTTAKIADSAVTTAKIASGNVTTASIADANVTTAKIADASITPAKLNGAQSGSAPIYGARAFVTFSVTAGTVAIRASGNVSSVIRNATGDFTINFATPMVDQYSAVNVTGYYAAATAPGYTQVTASSPSSVRVVFWFGSTPNYSDPLIGYVSAFR